MWIDQVAMTVAPYLPKSVKTVARRWFLKDRHPAHLGLRGFGAVQDLHYWVADGRLDTLVPVQNYFSVFFPMLDTTTTGTLTLFDREGQLIGHKDFPVGHLTCTKLRLSWLLRELRSDYSTRSEFGTLMLNLALPATVQDRVGRSGPFYFWDRFYIGYVNPSGQPTFVHGVDKTFICRGGCEEPERWYPPVQDYQWSPEMPINMDEYERFSVIMLNRVSRPKEIRLIVEDVAERRKEWEATIQPNGVHRFQLTPSNISGLAPNELRMRVEGMATQWGRPIVFKEFASGAISVMHC